MDNNIVNDKPLTDKSKDKFQRYNFSKRIAETIINRDDSNSIVIGLYGAWGEGKTTVLNFIRDEVNSQDSGIITLTFNPWRFPDEPTLLTSFFNSLADELMLPKYNTAQEEPERTTPKKRTWLPKSKTPLKSDWESLGDSIKKYGGFVSVVGADGAASTLGTLLSDVSIESLKSRMEVLLKNRQKRIVVFIDDIDRLDKDEIYALFRLVKLTGDFPYTTYVLSFDETLVASAISHRFGGHDQIAGAQFLEKIIQVPLRLPIAQKQDLQTFCFELIENAHKAGNIELNESENREFARKFSSNYLPKLITPRFAIRYCNAIAFSLPLMRGEVNLVDLMLIEALRVFFPEVYELVRTAPNFFIEQFQSNHPLSNDSENYKRLKELFDTKTSRFSIEDKELSQGAIQDLFPHLDKVWDTPWDFETGSPETRYQEKRICTQQYFHRYFSYTVTSGDISDVSFASFIDKLQLQEVDELIKIAGKFIDIGSPANFIDKLEKEAKSLESNQAIKIVKILCIIGDNFPDSGNGFVHWFSLSSKASLLIYKLIRHQITEAERFEVAKWAINNARPFTFIYNIHNNCRKADEDKVQLFSDDQYRQLNMDLKNKALEFSPQSPIWKSFPYESKFIMTAWCQQLGLAELQEYISNLLRENPEYVISFLKMFTGPITSNVHSESYAGDFASKHYHWLSQMVSPEIVFQAIKQIMGDEINNVVKYEILDFRQTDENIMKQFIYCHQHPSEKVHGQFG